MAASKITVNNASIDFPIFNSKNKSFKNSLINTALGGHLKHKFNTKVILVNALKNINLIINKGDRIGILGANGSGKTTLLRMLAGIYHPTKGDIKIEGHISSLINISLGIDVEATGRENIKFRTAMMGFNNQRLNEIIDEVIYFSGIGDFIDLPFRTYSSGMQMRLLFAISISISPNILIMDEWLSVGDAEFSKRAEKKLNDLINTTDILVIASHSVDLLKKICNRYIYLENGRIIKDCNFPEF